MGLFRIFLLFFLPAGLCAEESLQQKLERSCTVIVFQVESNLITDGARPSPRRGLRTGWTQAVVSGRITKSFRGLLKPGPFAFVWKDSFALTPGADSQKETPSAVVMQSPRKLVLFLRFLDAGETATKGHERLLYQGNQKSGDAVPWTPELDGQIAAWYEASER